MTESTEATQAAPAPAKPITIPIAQRQHDLVAQLLHQRAELDRQILTTLNATLAGSHKQPPQGANFQGTATAPGRLGRLKYFLVFAQG